MEHGTLLNVMWQPGWEGSWGRMDPCICMAESLHCSPETITTWFIGYTPIQNVFDVKKKLNKKEDGNWYLPFFTKECAILLSYPAPPSPSKTVHRSGTSHSSLGGPGLGVSTPAGSRLQSPCSQGPSHLSCFTPPEPHSCSWEW